MPDSAFPVRSTPFPSYLLDKVMPLLSDTEWRVLCVVVRATLGWEDERGGRKQADWLTQSQLKARTGRASEALSRAIDGLVQKDLVVVCSEAGEALASAQERRRCPGRMLFRLAPHVLDASPAAPDMANMLLLKDTEERAEVITSVSEQGHSLCEQGYSVSEVRKANTTKETMDKRTPGGVAQEDRDNVEKAVDNSAPGRTKGTEETSPEQKPASISDVQRFLLAYQEQFARHSQGGEAPPIAWGRDGRLVMGLLAQYGYERLIELLTRFFASEDAWVKKRGYALSCFPTLLPTLLMEAGQSRNGTERVVEAQRRAQATPVVVHGPSAQHWQHSGNVATSSASLFERYPHLRKKLREQPP